MIKALASSLLLSLCFCVPGWAEKTVVIDSNAIKQEIRNAVRDLQIQIPELLKAVRVRVQVPEIQVQIPEIRVQVPEILIPEIHLQVPVRVQISRIRIEIPKIDLQTPELPE